jgi:hypothetical protein
VVHRGGVLIILPQATSQDNVHRGITVLAIAVLDGPLHTSFQQLNSVLAGGREGLLQVGDKGAQLSIGLRLMLVQHIEQEQGQLSTGVLIASCEQTLGALNNNLDGA